MTTRIFMQRGTNEDLRRGIERLLAGGEWASVAQSHTDKSSLLCLTSPGLCNNALKLQDRHQGHSTPEKLIACSTVCSSLQAANESLKLLCLRPKLQCYHIQNYRHDSDLNSRQHTPPPPSKLPKQRSIGGFTSHVVRTGHSLSHAVSVEKPLRSF